MPNYRPPLLKDMLLGASLGLQLAAFVGVGAFIGYLLDIEFALKPWGLILGTVVGAVAGGGEVIRLAGELQK